MGLPQVRAHALPEDPPLYPFLGSVTLPLENTRRIVYSIGTKKYLREEMYDSLVDSSSTHFRVWPDAVRAYTRMPCDSLFF